MTRMADIKSNEDLTKALVAIKRSAGGDLNSLRMTKKHAKENGINWDHFLNTVRVLGLTVEAGGLGHVVTKRK